MAQCSLCKFELFASRVLCVAKHDPAFIAHGRNTGVQWQIPVFAAALERTLGRRHNFSTVLAG